MFHLAWLQFVVVAALYVDWQATDMAAFVFVGRFMSSCGFLFDIAGGGRGSPVLKAY